MKKLLIAFIILCTSFVINISDVSASELRGRNTLCVWYHITEKVSNMQESYDYPIKVCGKPQGVTSNESYAFLILDVDTKEYYININNIDLIEVIKDGK